MSLLALNVVLAPFSRQWCAPLCPRALSCTDNPHPLLAFLLNPHPQVCTLLAKMQACGVACAPSVLAAHRPILAGRLAAIKASATQLVGRDFNLSSSSQLAKVLYEDLRLVPPAGGEVRRMCVCVVGWGGGQEGGTQVPWEDCSQSAQ